MQLLSLGCFGFVCYNCAARNHRIGAGKITHTSFLIEKADSLRPEAVWIENNVCAILQHLEDCQLGAPRLRNPCKLAFEKLVLWDWLEITRQMLGSLGRSHSNRERGGRFL